MNTEIAFLFCCENVIFIVVQFDRLGEFED